MPKTLEFITDEKLTFNDYIKEKISKANKGIVILRNLWNTLPSKSLLTINKSFIRPHLDYGDVVYDQANETFCGKLEKSVQYNAVLKNPYIKKNMQGISSWISKI